MDITWSVIRPKDIIYTFTFNESTSNLHYPSLYLSVLRYYSLFIIYCVYVYRCMFLRIIYRTISHHRWYLFFFLSLSNFPSPYYYDSFPSDVKIHPIRNIRRNSGCQSLSSCTPNRFPLYIKVHNILISLNLVTGGNEKKKLQGIYIQL